MIGTICIFGDSITEGYHDTEGGWADRLKRSLWRDPQESSGVYNLGISGDNTAELLKRFGRECKMREPDVVIFAVGINDAQFVKNVGLRVASSDFEKNIDQLIDTAKQLVQCVVLVGLTRVDEGKVTPTSWNPDKYYFNENIIVYDEIIRTCACKHNCLYIAMHDAVDCGDLTDGLHPNAIGHEKMHDRIYSSLIDNNIIGNI